MSYELIALLLLGAMQVVALISVVRGFREMSRNFDEVSRIQRAIAGLVVQESEKVQQLLRA
ncbi:MAG: hypothetical protein ACREQY_11290 [Candidatus Binatia bacterium]